MLFPKTERQAEFLALAERLAGPIAARAPRHDRENSFPFESFAELHRGGYLALTVPEEYGGRGANPLEVALAQERLAAADGSVALGATMHLLLVGRLAETRAWPEELYAHLCQEIVERGALINSAASEPDMGSPSRGGLPATTAVRAGDGYRLSGRKSWTSLAPALTHIVVMAAVDDGEGPRRAHFLVPGGAPGLRIEETWDNLGMRATGSHDVVLDGVCVPAAARLPGEEVSGAGDPRGWAVVTGGVYLGIAVAARDFAVDFAQRRRISGQSATIATLPTIQRRVAEMELLLLQARTVLFDTAEAWVERPQQRDELAWRLAAAKHLATNHAITVTDLALRVVGSVGLGRDLPLERYFRDVRAGLGHPPMDDVALASIGKAALGL